MEALTILEKEKNISRDVMMDAIENSLLSACKNHFGTAGEYQDALSQSDLRLCGICGERSRGGSNGSGA